MIRILHYGLSSHLGGIETYLYKLYTHIDKEKFHFDFLTIGSKEVCFYNEFISMGSQFYNIAPRSENPWKNRKDLKDILTRENFDIVHCHMNTLTYTAPISLGLRNKTPVIVHSRNAQPPNILKAKILHDINSLFLPKGKLRMLAVSDLAGEWMFGKDADFTVINNGIDINRFKFNKESREKIRKELGIDDKQFCVIHVGAFRTQKNHMFLLETFKNILKNKPNSKLILVGTGRLFSEIESRAKELHILDNIIMVGRRADIPDLLSASDAFLFPSLFEGFPNAVLEAQASGLPCLISDTITKEVLINSNCYNFSLDKEPREWANKLLSIPGYEDRMKGSKNINKQGFSVEDEVKKIEKIYMNLL